MRFRDRYPAYVGSAVALLGGCIATGGVVGRGFAHNGHIWAYVSIALGGLLCLFGLVWLFRIDSYRTLGVIGTTGIPLANGISSRPTKLFTPNCGDIILLAEKPETFCKPKLLPEDVAVLRVEPDVLMLEMGRLRCRFLPDDLDIGLINSKGHSALLFSLRCGSDSWSVALYPPRTRDATFVASLRQSLLAAVGVSDIASAPRTKETLVTQKEYDAFTGDAVQAFRKSRQRERLFPVSLAVLLVAVFFLCSLGQGLSMAELIFHTVTVVILVSLLFAWIGSFRRIIHIRNDEALLEHQWHRVVRAALSLPVLLPLLVLAATADVGLAMSSDSLLVVGLLALSFLGLLLLIQLALAFGVRWTGKRLHIRRIEAARNDLNLISLTGADEWRLFFNDGTEALLNSLLVFFAREPKSGDSEQAPNGHHTGGSNGRWDR